VARRSRSCSMSTGGGSGSRILSPSFDPAAASRERCRPMAGAARAAAPVLALGGSVRGWWTYPGRGSRSPLSTLWRSFFGVKAGKVVFL
jgi:hypothetical protein